MEHVICRLPEPVAADLIDLGMAEPILSDRGSGLDILMEVLSGTANIVIIVTAKDAITEMVRSLFRMRRAELHADQKSAELQAGQKVEIKIGDEFYLSRLIPADAGMDNAAIAEIVAAVMRQLPGEHRT
jgi:hypothetical protein